MSRPFKFCPRCARPLETVTYDGVQRQRCADPACGFVHWNNPVPVVAAIIEHEGRVLLARNKLWPEKFFGLVTGFLEKDETPEGGVLREVEEEVGLKGSIEGFVGHYGFPQMNQLIIAFHVRASGTITLNDELAEFKLLAPEQVRPWPTGTGHAMRDWLAARGHHPEVRKLSPLQDIFAFLPFGAKFGTAGQPSAGQFSLIAGEGYQLVINLAMSTSAGALPDEAELVAGLGMQYTHIPVDFAAPSPEDLARFFDAVERAPGKVFVHCIANKRVSAFLFLYRVLKLGHPVAEAEMALHRIWTPDETWQSFIDRALRNGGQTTISG
ncbi:MAG: NUDIX domain-containing protein [Gammaproteobacteria bacterium]